MAKKKAKSTKTAKRKIRTAGAASTKHRVKRKTLKRSVAGTKTTRSKKALPTMTNPTALPPIDVETTSGGRFALPSLKGKSVVLYFYPKDDTPGCTTEGCDIRDRYADFRKLDTVVYGISRDGVDSHERFKAKFGFPFELIADPEEKLCRAFGVIQQKSLYGRTYMGVDRSTFIFDKAGLLRKSFRGVKVPGHVDQVLQELRKL
jgi:peroxiredoxin Q/BCP